MSQAGSPPRSCAEKFHRDGRGEISSPALSANQPTRFAKVLSIPVRQISVLSSRPQTPYPILLESEPRLRTRYLRISNAAHLRVRQSAHSRLWTPRSIASAAKHQA